MVDLHHYEKNRTAITAWSIAHGGFWEEETVWGTPRSTGPSGSPVAPYPREGLWYGLHGPFPLDDPLTLTELRDGESLIAKVHADLERTHGKPLYFPFQLRGDGLRAAQGYLTKMPVVLVDALPKLPDLLDDAPVSFPVPPYGLGRPSTGAGLQPGEHFSSADRQGRRAPAAARFRSDPHIPPATTGFSSLMS